MRQPLVPTPYTVLCRGRRIGVTDLGYTRYDESVRAGWFLPDSDAAADEGMDPANVAYLELHCPTGSIVPTEWIGIQDTERMIALAREHIDRWDADAEIEELVGDERWTAEVEWSPELDDDDCASEYNVPEWLTDNEDLQLPRYQILLMLLVPNAIP